MTGRERWVGRSETYERGREVEEGTRGTVSPSEAKHPITGMRCFFLARDLLSTCLGGVEGKWTYCM